MTQQRASYVDWLRYAIARSRLPLARLEEGMRSARRSDGEVLLLGAFHRTNLGDLALGEAVSRRLRQNFSIGNIQNAIRFSNQKDVVIGGGSLITRPTIERLRVAGVPPDRITAVGVDLWPRFAEDCDKRDLEYLRDIKRLSLRSRANYRLINGSGLFPPGKLTWSFDNAFSIVSLDAHTPRSGRVAINMMPYLFTLRGRRFNHGGYMATKIFGSNAVSAASNYVTVFRKAVDQLTNSGMKVYHFPFAAEDDYFARASLKGMDVRFEPFHPHTSIMMERLAGVELFFGSRYHAFVFALGLGVPFVGFAYAGKCENLAEDVDMPRKARFTNAELLMFGNDCEEKIQVRVIEALQSPFVLTADFRQKVADRVRCHLDRELRMLTVCRGT